MRIVTSLIAISGLFLAGCASSGGGAASGPSQIALPGGGSLSFSDGGYEAQEMCDYEDPAEAVAALRPLVEELKAAGDDPQVAQKRCVTMSMLANALYARYQQAQDLSFLKESIAMGEQTLAEVERVESAGIVTGISMSLINAQTAQEGAVPERQAELAKGGSF